MQCEEGDRTENVTILGRVSWEGAGSAESVGGGNHFREDYDTAVRILFSVYIICQYCLFDCLHCNRLKLHSSLNIINSNNNFGFVHFCKNLFFVRTAANEL